MNKFKNIVKKYTVLLSSREFAALYATLGSLSQVAHTYYLVHSISSFGGGFKIFQAILLSAFISTSLLYFVLICDKDGDPKEYKRNIKTVNILVFIEILINMYYYCQKLIIHPEGDMRIFDFIFAALVSLFIPFLIKAFSNQVKAKQWVNEIENKSIINSDNTHIDKSIEKIQEQLNKFTSDEFINTIYKIIEEKINEKADIIVKKMNINQPSIDDEFIKQKISVISKQLIKDELNDLVRSQVSVAVSDHVSKNLDAVEFENRYQSVIMKKIEDITHDKNDEFLKNIELKIQEAITNYKS
jgi:hypothetical protein